MSSRFPANGDRIWAAGDAGQIRHRTWATLGLAYTLLGPSLPEVRDDAGPLGVMLFVLAGTALIAALPNLRALLDTRLTPRQADGLAAATLLAVAGAILVLYPIANVHLPNRGSDRDDALVIATSALLRGGFPYRQLTYLGNPVTPLPGALLLAAPFVLVAHVELQNVLWVGAFYMVARSVLGDPRSALLLLCGVLATPSVLHELATSGDLFANGVYIAVFLVALTDRGRSGRTATSFWAVLLGVALSSRFTYPYLLPLLCAHLARTAGLRRAVLYTGVATVVFALVTLPFYLRAPADFAPLHMRAKLDVFTRVLPHPGVVVPVLTALGALGVCLPRSTSRPSLLLRAALVVGLPTFVLLLVALASAVTAPGEYLAMGVSFTGLAALGFAELLLGHDTLGHRALPRRLTPAP